MKNLSALHSNSYPLTSQPQQQPQQKRANLIVVKLETKEVQQKETSIANNPVNWDESWFCNYE